MKKIVYVIKDIKLGIFNSPFYDDSEKSMRVNLARAVESNKIMYPADLEVWVLGVYDASNLTNPLEVLPDGAKFVCAVSEFLDGKK
jgi:hypothetical protein